MATNKCSFCGALIPSGTKYCPNCGKPHIISSVNTPPQAVAPPPPVVPPPAATPPAPAAVPQTPAQIPNANLRPNQFAPKEKSNGLAVAIAIILSLAVLGGCGWAAYEFLIKDTGSEKSKSAKETVESVASSAVSQETSGEASAPDATENNKDDDDDFFYFDDEKGVSSNGNTSTDIPQGLDNSGEPMGMTDEEAAQLARNKTTPKTTPTKTAKKTNTPRRYSGEPMGMTDEEAAQMGRYSGEPMGMTDEEAAMMRKMNKRRR